jgi:hypothetical protein
MPSIVVPLILLFLASVWPLAVLIAIGFLIWVGHIQSAEDLPKFKPPSGATPKPRWGKIVFYAIVQLIWIPLFWSAVIWGFCGLNGSGTFG